MGEKIKEGIVRKKGYMLLVYGQGLDKSISEDKHSKNKIEIKSYLLQS